MWLILGVCLGAIVGPIGFAVMGRYNRRRLALCIAAFMGAWLVFLVVVFLRETYDINRVVQSIAILWQLGYSLAAAIGWGVGRWWRARSFAAIQAPR